MDFPIVTVNAPKESLKHQADVAFCKSYGMSPPAPSLAVRLHGRRVQKLGEWRGTDYHYAAIRELNAQKNTHYELIHPRYLNGA